VSNDVRALVARGSQVLGAADQGDLIWGHASVRDPDGRGVWIKRSGIGFEEVRTGDVHLVSPSGDVVEGDGRRHIEYPIHTEVMAARDDVRAVVHTHSSNAVAFAALDTPLLPISHEGTLFVPPDIARFTRTGDLITTPELGSAVAAELSGRNALLLVNHGIVTVGHDLATAVTTAVILDRACATQLRAMAAGPIKRWSDDEEALSKRDRCYSPALLQAAWEYLVRRLDRTES
jgi:ribulose-5-phosphate 4-epimerase/fuculose-1-phosphate aldolase